MAQHIKKPQSTTDSNLVARSLIGDKSAFAALIDRHRPRIERLLRVILNDWLETEDVWQETVLRAYLNLEQLRDPTRFGAWVCSIAINMARTQRSATFVHTHSWETLIDEAIHNPDRLDNHHHVLPEATMVRQELANRVRQAIGDLPPAEREALMLVYLNELSHKEAAIQLGSSLSAVKVRVHRGRRRLRAALQNEFGITLKETEMIKVNVHDVVMIVRSGEISPDNEKISLKPRLADLLLPHRILLLKEHAGDRAIAIWIHDCEAKWIAHHLKQQTTKRPITYDLTNTLLNLGQIEVERVTVSHLHEETFYGDMVVKTGSTVSEVDCRPSDAINLALRLDVPIFVAREIMAQESFAPDAKGNYSWAEYWNLRMRRAAETGKDIGPLKQEWRWQSIVGLDTDQLIKEHLEIEDWL